MSRSWLLMVTVVQLIGLGNDQDVAAVELRTRYVHRIVRLQKPCPSAGYDCEPGSHCVDCK